VSSSISHFLIDHSPLRLLSRHAGSRRFFFRCCRDCCRDCPPQQNRPTRYDLLFQCNSLERDPRTAIWKEMTEGKGPGTPIPVNRAPLRAAEMVKATARGIFGVSPPGTGERPTGWEETEGALLFVSLFLGGGGIERGSTTSPFRCPFALQIMRVGVVWHVCGCVRVLVDGLLCRPRSVFRRNLRRRANGIVAHFPDSCSLPGDGTVALVPPPPRAPVALSCLDVGEVPSLPSRCPSVVLGGQPARLPNSIRVMGWYCCRARLLPALRDDT